MNQSAGPLATIIYLIVVAVVIVSYWKIFVKAGKPGWAAIIPIYNIIVMLEIVGKPFWWFFLMLIPGVNVVVGIIVLHQLIIKFGKPGWHTVLAVLFSIVYFPYLAFSDAEFTGGSAS